MNVSDNQICSWHLWVLTTIRYVRLCGGMAQYHPEAGSALAWGVMARKDSGRDLLNPLGEENRRALQQAVGGLGPNYKLSNLA